jgi:hypothetical protein
VIKETIPWQSDREATAGFWYFPSGQSPGRIRLVGLALLCAASLGSGLHELGRLPFFRLPTSLGIDNFE